MRLTSLLEGFMRRFDLMPLRRSEIRPFAIALLLSVCGASAAKASTVIGTFGGGWDGWAEATSMGIQPAPAFGTADSAGITYYQSTTGATTGAPGDMSLEQVIPSANSGYVTDLGFDVLANNDTALVMANDTISIDWTVPGAGTAAGGYEHLVNVVMNSQHGGYANLGTSPLTTQYYYGGGGSSPTTVYGVTVNYDAYKAGMTGGTPGTYFQIEITTQSGGGAPGAMYFDNISLNTVPEPASFGMVGLAAAGLLKRRRR
jgi:PEP-CTERM motif